MRAEVWSMIDKKTLLEKAYMNYVAANLKMEKNDYETKVRWDEAPNPFIAWDIYKENMPERHKIIKQWLKAKKIYNKLKEEK